MMGLMALGFFAVYLLISIWVVKEAVSWAKNNNKRPWLWGGLVTFVMYNLLFWDWIPTLIMQKHYCDTQAGFWVYKTPEQWMKENPRMKEGVNYHEQGNGLKIEKIDKGNVLTTFLNKRSPVISENIDVSMLPLLHITKREHTLRDTKESVELSKRISFQAGHPSGAPKKLSHYRFWVNLQECNGKNGNTAYEHWARVFAKYANIGEEK